MVKMRRVGSAHIIRGMPIYGRAIFFRRRALALVEWEVVGAGTETGVPRKGATIGA
jgi:hypothetical protein